MKTFYTYNKYNKNTLPISHRQVEHTSNLKLITKNYEYYNYYKTNTF